MRRILTTIALLFLFGEVLASTKADRSLEAFPLTAGTYWLYRGIVRSSMEGSSVGKVTDVMWKMSVVRTIERDGFLLAVIRGFPADLDWSDGNSQPQPSILIETRDAKFYLNGEWNAQSVLDQIDDPKYSLDELVRDEDWFMQLPLVAGAKCGCDEEARSRTDGRYCWVVSAPQSLTLMNVKGVSNGTRTAYQVEYDTNPDDTEFEFVDGIGIVSYGYHHHGTTADTELRLIEFHPAEAKR
jgi:hypothetical protein